MGHMQSREDYLTGREHPIIAESEQEAKDKLRASYNSDWIEPRVREVTAGTKVPFETKIEIVKEVCKNLTSWID